MNQETKAIAEAVVTVGKQEESRRWWRKIAFSLFLVIIAQVWVNRTTEPVDPSHIAMMNIRGEISQDSSFWTQFDRLNLNDAKALLILINSPGGTPGDSERLYNAIEAIHSIIPVTVLIENQATSGAYLAALASDRIYAYNSALIGSIGVVFQHMIYKRFMQDWGVETEMITTGEYKGYPNSFEKMPQPVVENIQQAMFANHQWFLNKVIERRGLEASSIEQIKEAQIYSAIDGIAIGLIDGLSTRQKQLEYLRNEVGDLPVKDLQISEASSLLEKCLQSMHFSEAMRQSILSLLAQ